MLAQSLRTSARSLANAALRPTPVTLRRTFITPTAVRNADIIQDLYIKEIKAYKTPALKASDSEGQVHKFSAPAAPRSPEEADLSKDLKAYEDQGVDVEGASAPGAAPVEEDWFVEEAEEEAGHGGH